MKKLFSIFCCLLLSASMVMQAQLLDAVNESSEGGYVFDNNEQISGRNNAPQATFEYNWTWDDVTYDGIAGYSSTSYYAQYGTYAIQCKRNGNSLPRVLVSIGFQNANGLTILNGWKANYGAGIWPKPGTYYVTTDGSFGGQVGYCPSTSYLAVNQNGQEAKGYFQSGYVRFSRGANGYAYVYINVSLGYSTFIGSIGRNYIIATVNSNDDSRGTVTGSGQHTVGQDFTIEATPNPGSTFLGWSDGDLSNPRIVNTYDDSEFTAVFAQEGITLANFSYTDSNNQFRFYTTQDGSNADNAYFTPYSQIFNMIEAKNLTRSTLNYVQLGFLSSTKDYEYPSGEIGPQPGTYYTSKPYYYEDYYFNPFYKVDGQEIAIGYAYHSSLGGVCPTGCYLADFNEGEDIEVYYQLNNAKVIVSQGANGRMYIEVRDIGSNSLLCTIGDPAAPAGSVDAITLEDNRENSFYNTFKTTYHGATGLTVTYPRQFAEGRWSTMCLPFSLDLATMIANKMYGCVYEFKYATGNANVGSGVNLYFSNAKSIEAGKCYIVNANAELAAKTSFVFSGVTIDLSKDNGAALDSKDDYDDLWGYNSQGTIELVGTLRNGTLKGVSKDSQEGNTYMGLKSNKIYYPNTGTGSTIWAYRGIFRSSEFLDKESMQKMRIIVDGEDRGELIIDADGDILAPSDAQSRKFIRDGVLYIEREGVIYDAQGKRVEGM